MVQTERYPWLENFKHTQTRILFLFGNCLNIVGKPNVSLVWRVFAPTAKKNAASETFLKAACSPAHLTPR